MNWQRLWCFLLIATQAGVMAYFSGTLLFPGVVVAVAAVSSFSSWRLELSRRNAAQAAGWLAVLFAIKFRIAPHTFSPFVRGMASPLAYAVAQYLLTLQVGQSLLRRNRDALPPSLPALGAIVMVCVADVRATAAQQNMLLVVIIWFAICAAFFCASARQPTGPRHADRLRKAMVLVSLLLTAIVSWGFVTGLVRYGRGLDIWLARTIQAPDVFASAGFSRTALLGSIAQRKNLSAEKIALRVYSDHDPGYLRGMAFDTFRHSQWTLKEPSKPLSPGEAPSGMAADTNFHSSLFALGESDAGPWQRLDIWPEASLAGNVLLPLETTHVEASVERLWGNRHRIVTAEDLPAGYQYRAHVSGGSDSDHADARFVQRLTAVPVGLDPRIVQLAAQICRDCRNTQQKLAAVQSYFHSKYRYQIGITVPPGKDPISYFLLERPPAHCEYFATGATLLLRLQGVPCRYVTGFVASRRNEYGDYWFARNEDAHAWVEAYDAESRRWSIVEATPSAGLPSKSTASSLAQLWDYMSHQVYRFRVLLHQGGLPWLLRQVLRPLALALVCLLPIIWLLLRKRRSVPQITPTDPVVAEMRRLLAKMDSRLHRAGLERRRGETLHQFASRIDTVGDQMPCCEETASWYRDYASTRYRGDPNRQAVAALAELP
jgi:transglutaminase-like putative cysteine protease